MSLIIDCEDTPMSDGSGCVPAIVATVVALALGVTLYRLVGTPWAPDGPDGTVVRIWVAEETTDPGRMSHRIEVRPADGGDLVTIRATRREADACPERSIYPDCLKKDTK